MFNCDCQDYCEWCHPEMCGASLTPAAASVEQLQQAKQILADIARATARIGKNL